VLGHLDAVRAARARERHGGRRVGPEPLLAAAGERLDPAQTRRAGGQAGGRTPGQQRVGSRQQRVRRVTLQRCGDEIDGGREPGCFGCAQVGLDLVEPEQDGRSVD
jgi:hypothetical protein